ncbi:MAG: hypothetical protein ACRD6U_05190, partial [Nitrososphaeraceae archaeon]
MQSANASGLQLRQEIKDSESGIVAKPLCGGSIIQSIEDFTFKDYGHYPKGDIKAIYYNIRNQTLDSTIWFSSDNREANNLTSFAIVIDADSNPYTGRDGIEYKLEIYYDNKAKAWLNSLIELSPLGTGGERMIDYNNNFTNINFRQGYVSISLDLKKIVSPTNFSIMSYSAMYLEGYETENSNKFNIEHPAILVDVT